MWDVDVWIGNVYIIFELVMFILDFDIYICWIGYKKLVYMGYFYIVILFLLKWVIILNIILYFFL